MTSVSSTTAPFSCENLASQSSNEDSPPQAAGYLLLPDRNLFSFLNLRRKRRGIKPNEIKNPHLPKSSGTNPTTPTGALSASNSDEKTTTNANKFFLNEPTIDGDPKRKRTPDTNNSITKKRKINPVQKSETSAEQFDDVVLAKSAPAESPIIDVYGRTPEQIKPLQLAFDYMNEYCPIHKEYLNDSKFLIDLFEKYQNDSKYKEMLNKEAAEELVGLQIMEHLDNILQIVGKCSRPPPLTDKKVV